MAEPIVNTFTVNRSIDEAWNVLCDLERIAPCLPGAQLTEIEGNIHRGKVSVKFGRITTRFAGQAHIVERDDLARSATLVAAGSDSGGRSSAMAEISAIAESLSPTSTKCTVVTDLHISGKVAQFGWGVIQDVSKNLTDQFATNLNEMLDQPTQTRPIAPSATDDRPRADQPGDRSDDADRAPGAAPAHPAGNHGSDPAGESAAATTPSDAPPAPTIRKIDGPAAAPVDLTDMAGPAVLKRLGPAAAAVALLVLILRRRR